MMRNSSNRQNGSAIVTASIWLVVLVGLTALAVDVGRLMVIRNELQNAADAAALAGANCLDKTTATSGTDCTSSFSSTLNWTVASTKAKNSIGLNKSDNASLVDGVVEAGYWNVNGGAAIQPTTLSPIGPCTISGGVMVTACDKPAVRVTVSRATGSNGGPVGVLVSTMFGGAKIPISASAVAVLSSPSQVLPGAVIPFAINLCLFNKYWDSVNNVPVLFKSTDVDPYGWSKVGQPWELVMGSSYHYGTCDSGQWTTFGQDLTDVPSVRNLIDNGNPNPLSIGQNTYIEPGTKTNLFDYLGAAYIGKDVTVIVVDTTSLASKGFTPIVAFAGFHIDDAVGGSTKYVKGHFIKGNITNGSSGIGPSFGTYTPPRLAQ